MTIIPKGKIVARSGKTVLRKVEGSSISSFLLTLERILLQCGWQKTITGMVSRAYDTNYGSTIQVGTEQLSFESRVYVYWDINPALYIEFRAESIYDLAIQDTALPLRLYVSSSMWIFANPYQFMIFPEISTIGNNSIYIGTLKLPPFAYGNPFLQCILACEAEDLFSTFNNNGFGIRSFVACLKGDGTVSSWTNVGGQGAPFIAQMAVNSSTGTFKNGKLKCPTFVGWGTASNAVNPTLKGFFWDSLIVLDYDTYSLFRTYLLDRSEIFMTNRYFDNVFTLEVRYGVVS